MLELQRASAGSGKTYTLARKFIWYFITIPDNRRRRLRTKAELADSLSHILAVTFTNKATGEMQQRIVEKLHALAFPPSSGTPDYQKDFLKELNEGVEPEEQTSEDALRKTCMEAVNILLNNYSDFHVSTIDSFFQQVLRTFAYESDLSDSYRVELDSDLLSSIAIDGLLEDINTGNDITGAAYWISALMERVRENGGKWNIFTKSPAGENPYGQLLMSAKRLENEDFKQRRKALDEYFDSGEDLVAIYEDMRDRYESLPVKAYKTLMSAVDSLLNETERFRRTGVDVDARELNQCLSRIKDAKKLKPKGVPDMSKIRWTAYKTDTGAYAKRKKQGDTAAYERLEELNTQLEKRFEEWKSVVSGKEFRQWKLYRETLPFLGLLRAIIDKRNEYLRESNAVELGETNSILSGIIGEDDAPFIYERIGTRINHFLIDEFQDTSRMQWNNMHPLLRESIGRGNENLIIGDAKQSIYRFRNADSTLISKTVPDEFGLPDASADNDPAKNTNWRSDLRVVQFNNSFFDFLTVELNRLVGVEADTSRRDHRRDYTNVVQIPHKRDDSGYVEVRIGENSRGREEVLTQLPGLVASLVERGCRLRDIAVLVNKNSEGESVIAQFTAYNASGAMPRIEFVSEQSLLLSSSVAVAIVVSVLETISRGADPEIRQGDKIKSGIADWTDIACNFRFYALSHPEFTTPECLEEFFKTGGDNNAIGEMLGSMQAVSLPALVEAITAKFVDQKIRESEAVFLAAFQDLVLEYCENHPSDIASFLKWWEEKKKKASISSPEGLDAVQVMTVHKSKGLEFPVVIVPFANYSFKDESEKSEWRWVKPEILESEKGRLPAFIPVETSSMLESTSHEHVLREFYDQVKADILNTVYVAFTRAVSELYVFAAPESKSNPDLCKLSSMLRRLFEAEPAAGNADIRFLDPSLESIGGGILRYGRPFDFMAQKEREEKKKAEKEKEKKENGDCEEAKLTDESVITDYHTTRETPKYLVYKEQNAPSVKDADEFDPSEDRDPRSEGNLLHQIMESVEVRGDIPRAARRLVMKGLIDRRSADEMTALLEKATAGHEVAGWFDGTARVITERPLLRAGKKVKRPDRVMISGDGDVTVVDYKFGESVKSTRVYASQVRGYVEALKDTGRYRSVRGYLWYVRQNRVEFVSD